MVEFWEYIISSNRISISERFANTDIILKEFDNPERDLVRHIV
jgi:hypothetical protein